SCGQEGGRRLTMLSVKFRALQERFAISRLAADAPIPDWATSGDLVSVTRTLDELSIVCPANNIPPDQKPELVWVALKLEGPFAFSETGILASFIGPLGAGGVPIFAVSTFDTDYVLVWEQDFVKALEILQTSGHICLPHNPP